MRLFFCIGIFLVTCGFTGGDITVSGRVTENGSSEPVIGAVIVDNGKSVVNTDGKGRYSFLATVGEHTLIVNCLGYRSSTRRISLSESDRQISFDFQLHPDPFSMDSVVVTANRTRDVVGITPMLLSESVLNSVPKFFESDPIRSVHIIPGVSSGGSDFSTQVYMRGGNFDETMIALDGIPLYNPYHFGGLFSMVSTDILQREDVYRSNYPVYYGGVASGIVDMISKEGQAKKTKGSAGIAISSIKGNIDTPFLGGTLFLSARRFWLNLTRAATESDKPNNYYFYDLYGKYVYQINTSHSIAVSHYHSTDVNDKDYSPDLYTQVSVTEPINWYNRISHVRWNYTPDDNNGAELSVYRSVGGTNAGVSSVYNRTQPIRYDIDNKISEAGVKFAGYYKYTTVKLTYGVDLKHIRLHYRWDIQPETKIISRDIINLTPHPQLFFDYAPNKFSYERSTTLAELYASIQKHVTERIDISMGLRASFVKSLHAWFSSPYIGIQYALSPDIIITAGYGRYFQYLYALKDSKSQNNTDSPFNAYFLSSEAQNVLHSDHFALGMKLPHLPLGLSVEVEGFFKDRRNVASSYSEIDRPLVFENGAAMGVDVLVRKPEGFIKGMLAYSFSRSFKRNAEYEYFVNSDRTHTLKGIVSIMPLKKLTFDCSVNAATGVPYTDIIGKYVGYDDKGERYRDPSVRGWNPIYGRKNGVRTKAYVRADIGFTGSFPFKKSILKPFLQFLNIFDSPNPYGVVWKPSEQSEHQKGSSVIPSIGLIVDF